MVYILFCVITVYFSCSVGKSFNELSMFMFIDYEKQETRYFIYCQLYDFHQFYAV